jgi:CBS domain-containing protein
MTVFDCCQRNVVSVTPEASVSFVTGLMKDKNIGCVVVTSKDRPVGIVTDRDIVLRRVTTQEDPDQISIDSLMTRDIVTIRGDAGIFEAIQQMKTAGVRRMPVVDLKGHLVALLTVDDIIRLIAREMADIARIIGKESPTL